MKTPNPRIMSMSGYGRGVVEKGGWRAACEIRTVNHRNLDVSLSLPSGLLAADSGLRRILRSRLSRGRVEMSVWVSRVGSGKPGKPMLDLELAAWYGRRFRKLARELRLPLPAAEGLAVLPGVLEKPDEPLLPRAAVAAAGISASVAVEGVLEMRAREGAAMARDLDRRLAGIKGAVSRLERRWDRARAGQALRINRRLADALEGFARERKPATAKEIIGMVERGDINEELVRLRSLMEQFRRTIKDGSPAGRRLDFIAQEMQREINTMSAKCGEASLTATIMPAREDIDRIREQVQNIE